MEWWQPWLWVAGSCVLLAVVIAIAVTGYRRRRKRRIGLAGTQPAESRSTRVALIVNPRKIDSAQIMVHLEAICWRNGWEAPLQLETTEQDFGYGQARRAVAEGANLLLVAGGDGTVREVAHALQGRTDVSMGLIPTGTGNLLARNLDIPLGDIPTAVDVALTGHQRVIDVGHVKTRLSDEGARKLEAEGYDPGAPGVGYRKGKEDIFLVMSGLGFDAKVMADVREDLKRTIGWWAYVDSGVRNFPGKRTRVQIELDGQEPHSRKARTVVVGNCGTLPANIDLFPEALIDDGILDVVSIAPRTPLAWARVARQVLTGMRDGQRSVEHFTARHVALSVTEPLQAEIDGDPVGYADHMELSVVPRALTVRVPADQAAVGRSRIIGRS